MNVNFKLVWFEDEDSSYDAYCEELISIIKSFFLIPDIKRYRDFSCDLDVIKDADLILADYDLGTDNSVNLIHNFIRSNEIVIDALMYSSKYDRMVSEIQAVNPLLEGVFCAKRGTNDLTGKFSSLVYRIVKRAQSIENLRGMVMEYSSVFDQKISSLIQKFAGSDLFNPIIKYINDKIEENKKRNIFKACNKKGSNCYNNCEKFVKKCNSKSGCCYSTTVIDLKDLEKYEPSDRSRILGFILKELIKKGIIKEEDSYKNFHKNFNSDIIIYRNALAHQKSDENKLYIQATKQFIEINDSLFSRIKGSIVEYIEFFKYLESVSL